MGNQNSKKKVKKLSRMEQEQLAAKNEKRTKIFLLVFASIALVGVIIGIGVGIAAAIDASRYNDFVDYKSNMADYIYISPEDYKNIDVNMLVNIPGDHEIDLAIMKLLYNNRKDFETDDLNGDGIEDDKYHAKENVKNQTIKLGDTANIFYRGYYINDDGDKIYFDGGCNFASSSASSDKPTSLGIGSGSMIDGIETGLIGKNMKDYATLQRISSGDKVKEGDIVYISYDSILYSGTSKKNQYALVDLSDPKLSEKWGEGFAKYLLGKDVGVEIKDPYLVTNKGENGTEETDIYSSVTVEKIIRINATENRPVLVVDAQFPLNYKSEELAGKDAKFEIFIMTTQLYSTPEFNDEFITETLKVTAEDLADYEGDTLTDKYRAKILEEKMEEHDEVIYNTFALAMWEKYTEKVVVKKYPMGSIKRQYDAVVAEIESFYNYYKSSYGFTSIKDAAEIYLESYYGVTGFTDWQAAVEEQAKLALKRMMTLYYIADECNFKPNDEEFKAAYDKEYNETFESYLENLDCTPEEFDTTEEYEKKKAEHKIDFDEYYDEDYFTETVYYDYAVDKILENFANIIYPEQ